MNVWSEILDILAKNKQLFELIIAPNAPPLSRNRGVCSVVSSKVFSAADVEETLGGVVMRSAGKKLTHLPQAGILCVGGRDVGRLRICYFTQRGSRVLRIVRIPFEVPDIASVCTEPAQALEIAEAIGTRQYRAVLVYGTNQSVNSQVCYALLNEINNRYRQVIYVVEPTLSYLLAHHNSLVIQAELLTDVATWEEAVGLTFMLEPSVVHLGDVKITDSMPSLRQLFLSDVCTLVSTLAEEPGPLLDQLPPPPLPTSDTRHSAILVKVWPDADGKVKLETKPWSRTERKG
jgi:twitching motility protein PilT